MKRTCAVQQQKLVKPEGKPRDIIDIPQAANMVETRTLLPKGMERMAGNTSVFAVEIGDKAYFAKPTSMVPAGAEIQRSKDGHLCGYPAVGGG